MVTSTEPAAASLVRHCLQQLEQCVPMASHQLGEIHLLEPHSDFSPQQHCDALDSLIERGVLAAYRYIEAVPNAAILAVRA